MMTDPPDSLHKPAARRRCRDRETTMQTRTSFWLVWLLTAVVCGSANAADPPAQPTVGRASPPAVTTTAGQPEDFAARRQRFQDQLRRQQALEAARRPTDWQLQNPSNPANRSPTSLQLGGYVAPNTYFGPQFRDWSHQSPPVSQTQRPANITPVPLLEQTGAPIAPYTYWGPDNARWSHVTINRAEPDPFGGWRLRPGR
jgi:hypothetical protein